MNLNLGLEKYKDALRFKDDGATRMIWDPIRMKFLVSQPEEMVRQLFLQFLLNELKISQKKIVVEKQIKLFKKKKRYDIAVFGESYNIILLVECKSFKTKLDQNVLDQIAMYNSDLEVPFLLITNGRESYICRMDYKNKSFSFLDEFPFKEF